MVRVLDHAGLFLRDAERSSGPAGGAAPTVEPRAEAGQYLGHISHQVIIDLVVFNQYRRQHGDKAAQATALGHAISYRFKRDGRGWRVFSTTRLMDVPVVTDQCLGAIAVDLNADHLAVAETDASGNYLPAWRVPLVTYGKSSRQAEALVGDAVAGVVEYARESGETRGRRGCNAPGRGSTGWR